MLGLEFVVQIIIGDLTLDLQSKPGLLKSKLILLSASAF